jgi:hypothetical protein
MIKESLKIDNSDKHLVTFSSKGKQHSGSGIGKYIYTLHRNILYQLNFSSCENRKFGFCGVRMWQEINIQVPNCHFIIT